MPDKLYQECRTLISGCRAIFEDLREAGIDILPLSSEKIPATTVVSEEQSHQVRPHNPVAQETLADIQSELTNCQRCALNKNRKQIFFGSGNPKARLVLIGDVLDSEEESQGEPFAGEAGQLLDRILFAMKLSRDDIYICNVVKCRPPNNPVPEKSETSSCEAYLKRQLLAIAPEIILSLGQFATQALLQTDESIRKLRGRWQSYAGIALMPTFHPAYLLKEPVGKHEVWEDVKQVMHRLQD